MRIHWLIHEKAERPGIMEQWFMIRGFTVTETLMGKGSLPGMESFDFLLVMGGPMGTYEENSYPWLKGEKAFIRQAIEAGKGVLGICLGSQLIAASLGCRVYPNKQKEIGWFPITTAPGKVKASLFEGCPDTLTVMHWHGDTFDRIAEMHPAYSSGVTPNQAFQYGDRVAGLQFHPEMTEGLLAEFCDAFEVVPGPSVQTREKILAGRNHIAAGNHFLFTLLENWLKTVSEQW